MDVAVTSSLTQLGLLYDALLQVVNPRFSATGYDWGYRAAALIRATTVDRYYTDIPLSEPNFLVGTSRAQFDRITDGMAGSYANRNSGIFLARGSVNVQGTDLFDVSEDIPFKVLRPGRGKGVTKRVCGYLMYRVEASTLYIRKSAV
jgi:hypothetical protein